MKKVLYLGLDPQHYKAEGEIIHLPLIQIVPRKVGEEDIQSALSQFDLFTHLILTSKTSIKILVDYLPMFGYDINTWKKKKTIVVGKATGIHLQKEGITPFLVAKEETAEGIINELQLLSLCDSFFFWPHSAQARPVLSSFFQTQQIPLVECHLYETVMRIPEKLPFLSAIDEIVFTSPSTVQAFLKIFGGLPKDKILTPIGPVTAEALDRV